MRVVRIGSVVIDLWKGSAMRFGLTARVGMNDYVGHRELAQNAFFSRHDSLMGRHQGEVRIQIGVHLQVYDGT